MIASLDHEQDTKAKRFADDHGENSAPGDSSDLHPLGPMIEQLAELREYLLHYLEAHKDKTKATVRHLIVATIILISVGIACFAALTAGAVLFVYGMAEAVGVAFGNRSWAGHIVVGGSLMMSMLLVIVLLTVWSSRSARRRTIHKYERRHRIQRARFGRNAKHRSAS